MRISIVIATKNRLAALRSTIRALARQTLGEHEAEVVVVDNGSTDGTLEWLEHCRAQFPLPLEVFSEPTPGVSAARNAGVRRARHGHILFLNDDTAPADEWLVAGHIREHLMAGASEIAVLGGFGETIGETLPQGEDGLARSSPTKALVWVFARHSPYRSTSPCPVGSARTRNPSSRPRRSTASCTAS